MRIPSIARSLGWLPPLSCALTLLLAACTSTAAAGPTGTRSPGASSPTSGSVAEPSATSVLSAPASTATATPPQHAFGWFQYDGSHVPQLWASLNGASPVQITHLAPITDGCNTEIAWSPPVFSPDLTHIAVSVGSFNCGDGDMTGPLSVVTVAGGAVASVPGSGGSNEVRTNQRTAGWLNSTTIWYVNYNGLYTYTLGAASVVQLPGPVHVEEAVLRGSTLFWEENAFAGSTWTYTLHRYDMSAHAALPGTITLGQVHECQCSPGDFHTPGWDAAPDGTHVAFQSVTASAGPDFGIASSKISYASADGTGTSQIASYLSTSTLVRMQIAPNGRLVAFTTALPSPSVITASVSTPGGKTDPTFHAYTPDAVAFPVWKWDNSQFWAATKEDTNGDYGGASALENYAVGAASGTTGVAGGYNPWYTIGG
jgi:hypothetical protein